MTAGKFFFSTIEIFESTQTGSRYSFAIVNLKPIVPGHVLVVPRRCVARISELHDHELSCLMKSIRTVGKVIERAYGADALTVACQDGKAAGQSIPHVHFHLLPRKLQGDRFSQNNDAVYPALEKSEASLQEPLKVDADEDRVPRTLEEMEKEANWLSSFFESNTSSIESNDT